MSLFAKNPLSHSSCAEYLSCPLPHPNSGLPEFGIVEWQKSDISDFCWRGWGEGVTIIPYRTAGATSSHLLPHGEKE